MCFSGPRQNLNHTSVCRAFFSWQSLQKAHYREVARPSTQNARPSRVLDAEQGARETLPLIYCLKTLHGVQPLDWQLTLAEELIVWFVYQWSFEWKRESNKMSTGALSDWFLAWPVTLNVYASRFVGADQAGANFNLVCLQNLSNNVWI